MRRRTRISQRRARPRERGLGDFFARVYGIVRRIPRGRVATYGQVAVIAGVPRGARAVGWALRVLDERSQGAVPWHRVVGAGGRISLRGVGHEVQKRRLRAEGVTVRSGSVDIARHGLGASRLLTMDGRRGAALRRS